MGIDVAVPGIGKFYVCWKAEEILCCHELNSQKLKQRFIYHILILNNPKNYNIFMGVSLSNQLRLDHLCFEGIPWQDLCFFGVLVSLLVLPAFLSFCRT